MEALACAKPVVTTWEADTLVIDGESGLRVPAGDVDALAQALLKLLRNEGLRERMGSSARAIAEEFALEHIARKFVDVYHGLLG